MTEAELREIIAPFGKVLSLRIITDQYSRPPKNTGYVEMRFSEQGKPPQAILKSQSVNNRLLVVRTA